MRVITWQWQEVWQPTGGGEAGQIGDIVQIMGRARLVAVSRQQRVQLAPAVHPSHSSDFAGRDRVVTGSGQRSKRQQTVLDWRRPKFLK
jgi:hypothetical protein